MLEGWPAGYFHDRMSALDVEILGVSIGGSSAHQAAEALGVLVGMRQWKTKRVNLSVNMGRVSALTVLLRCKTAGDAP